MPRSGFALLRFGVDLVIEKRMARIMENKLSSLPFLGRNITLSFERMRLFRGNRTLATDQGVLALS